MHFVKVLLLFFLCQAAKLLADDMNTDISACGHDLTEFCGMDSFLPYSVQFIYDSRACLRDHRNSISKQCLNYLELDKPSIIESCFTEMKTYCDKVVPGGFRLHSCLSAVPASDLSPPCQDALAYDQELVIPKGDTDNAHSFWTRWAKYFIKMSDGLMAMQMQLSQANWSPNLRGLRFIGMQGNDDERNFYLSDDDNNSGSSAGGSDDDGDEGDDDNDGSSQGQE